MIDVMDKHFQEELNLTLAQSAWVQFAHYLGYFLMALPAGWLATKMGYKGGIIAGLLLVAVGGFWFIPATQIAAFWAFLLGVCIIAAGLTFSKPSLIPTRPCWGLLNTERAASISIVMAIMGGAILPKLMGAVADKYDLSRGFIVPLLCFAVVAAYGYLWPRLSGHEAMHGVSATGGH
jgi:fucose permease